MAQTISLSMAFLASLIARKKFCSDLDLWFCQGIRFVHPFREVPLSSSFEVDTQDYLVENGGIVITNPNAPTGIYINLSIKLRKS